MTERRQVGRYDDRATTEQEIRAMPDLTAIYNNRTLASNSPSNNYSVAGTLGGHPVQSAPAPQSKAGPYRTFGRYRRKTTDVARRGALRAVAQKKMKDDNGATVTAKRDHLEPFTCLLDPVFNRIHETAAALGVIPPAEIPPVAPPPPHSMNDFLDSLISRNFLCAIQGQPCHDRSGDLGGKVVIMGFLLDEPDDFPHGLIEDHLRKGDLVISPAIATDLESEAVRRQACFGAPAEQCVAIAEDDIAGGTGEAVRKLQDLALRRLRLIDPDYADQLEETHRAQATEAVARFDNYQNAASRLSSLAPPGSRAAIKRLSREISETIKVVESRGMEENAERGARYAARIRELTDGARTIYVPAPMAIVDTLQIEFINDPDVVVVARPASTQRWEEHRASRM